MIFVIVGPVDQQDWTWGNAGNHVCRARMVVVHPVVHLSCYQSSWSEHRRDITFDPGKNIGIDTIGNDRFDRRLIGGCQNECRATQRDTPPGNGTWPTEF